MFYKVLGLMSGTSLDGLDIAYCEFELKDEKWHYQIKHAETIPYTSEIVQMLLSCENCSGEMLSFADYHVGRLFGQYARTFLDKYDLSVDFIASHGQTIFHQPSKGFTTQIGNISALSVESRCTVVGDFRAMDVALGGQGAPLVPIGDEILFGEYPCCLNLGGFSNISYKEHSKRIAYDICPVNMVMNHLANMLGKPFDENGKIAKSGKIDDVLLSTLNSIPYYSNHTRSSLGKEWVNQYIFPLVDYSSLSVEDIMATYLEHIAIQIAYSLKGDTLLTGGGARNSYLVEKIREKTNYRIIVPDNLTIDFKEALIFAFLGLKRMRGEVNCLASVTGARQDSCSGLIAVWNNV